MHSPLKCGTLASRRKFYSATHGLWSQRLRATRGRQLSRSWPATVRIATGKCVGGILLVLPVSATIHNRHALALRRRDLLEIDVCPARQLHDVVAQLADIVAHLAHAGQLEQVEDAKDENREHTQGKHNHDAGTASDVKKHIITPLLVGPV